MRTAKTPALHHELDLNVVTSTYGKGRQLDMSFLLVSLFRAVERTGQGGNAFLQMLRQSEIGGRLYEA